MAEFFGRATENGAASLSYSVVVLVGVVCSPTPPPPISSCPVPQSSLEHEWLSGLDADKRPCQTKESGLNLLNQLVRNTLLKLWTEDGSDQNAFSNSGRSIDVNKESCLSLPHNTNSPTQKKRVQDAAKNPCEQSRVLSFSQNRNQGVLRVWFVKVSHLDSMFLVADCDQ